jgi:mycothiol synthase
MTPSDFARLVARHDGVGAFNEASRMALADALPGRVEIVIHDGPSIIALAYASSHAPVELAVHPAHRRRGHATALLDRLLEQGETRFWAHGDQPAARAFADANELQPERTLLRLARALTPDDMLADRHLADVVIRPFHADDLSGLLTVNARAFAFHPEQGGMDHAVFAQRAAEAWFDPAGIFVAEQAGEIVGFHWTKVDEPERDELTGEVYVLAVDPACEGQHIGSALLARGLAHLANAGVGTAELYLESDNAAALALYRSHGFTEAGRDVLYVSTTPASGARDLS